MQEIFISYSRADSAFGKKLHQDLTQAGHQPWMDWINIPPSSHWWEEIQEGIEAAATIVFIISPDSIASPVCHLEVAHARLHNKRIVPVLYREIDEKVAFKRIKEKELGIYLETVIQNQEMMALARANWIELSQINWIIFTNPTEYKKQLWSLLKAIETDLDYVRDHTRIQVWSLEWEKESRHNDFLLRGTDLAHAQEWLAKASDVLQPSPTDLQGAFIKASIEYEKNQASKRKRLRNGIVSGALAIIILPYLWLSTRFYIDTVNSGFGLVVRAGDPGLKILPGFDFATIGTDYSISDIADPYRFDVANEKIQGFWIPSQNWGEKLYPLLQPSQSGLAYWRSGQHEQAIAVLAEAVCSSDQDAVKTLSYLAFLNPEEASKVVDGLLPALGGDKDTRQIVLQSFDYLRRLSPELASKQAERLVSTSYSDPNMQIWAIEASGLLAADPNVALGGILELMSKERAEIANPTANAFDALVSRGVPVQPAQIDKAIQKIENLPAGPQETVIKAILGLDLSTLQKEKLRQISLKKLGSPVPSEQTFALQSLSDLNSEDSQIILQTINRLHDDPDQAVRASLPDLLLKLSHHEPAGSFDLLADLVLTDSSEFVRYDALQAFHGWFEYDPEIMLPTLVKASGDSSDLVRVGSLETMVDLELETSCCLDEAENALASKLDDESFEVRLAAAQGLLLLSDQVENSEHLLLAAQIISQLFVDLTLDNRASAQNLAERYTNPEAIIVTGKLLHPYLQDVDSVIYEYTSFFGKALETQPQAIPSISVFFSSLLQIDEIKGDVIYFIWQTHQQNPDVRVQTLAAFIDQMRSEDIGAKQNSLEALSILATLDRETAKEALQAISQYQNDTNPALRASAIESIGTIGENYPDLVSSYLPALLKCIRTSSNALQLSCSQAVLDYASAEGETTTPQFTKDLYQLLADPTFEPNVRISIARALVSVSPSIDLLSRADEENLVQQIDAEQDKIAKFWLAGVLAAYGNPDAGQVDFAFSFLTQHSKNADASEREEIVTILLSLGQQQPVLGQKVIKVLETFVSDPDYSVRVSATISIREVSLTDIQNARQGLESLLPALTSPQDSTRWEAVANGVSPLIVAYPELADRVVELLNLSYQKAIKDADNFSSLSKIQENQILAYEILGKGNPDLFWPMITSPNYDKRFVGRAAMVRVLKTKPELIPQFQMKLAELKDGCQPHVCLSVSLATEMTILLQNSEFIEILQEQEAETQFIDWLPSYLGIEPLGSKFDPPWSFE